MSGQIYCLHLLQFFKILPDSMFFFFAKTAFAAVRTCDANGRGARGKQISRLQSIEFVEDGFATTR